MDVKDKVHLGDTMNQGQNMTGVRGMITKNCMILTMSIMQFAFVVRHLRATNSLCI